jgi:hypothetical protein
MDRKTKERDRNLILSGGADGIMRSAGAMGVGFLGSLLSPLDLALNFFPIVGVAGTGAKAVGIGAKVSRALSRGIVTRQTLAARGIAMKGYTAAIIEGTVGQAITEIPLMISNKQDQTRYTSAYFITNVALGGAFGAGVHSLVKLGKSIHGRMKEAKLAHGRLTPETHENMAGTALEDFLEGGEIDPARVMHLDDNANTAAASEPDFSEVIAKADLSDPYAKIIAEADLSTPKEPSFGTLIRIDYPEELDSFGLEDSLLLSKNPSVGKIGHSNPGEVQVAAGAIEANLPEGPYRVTPFIEGEPSHHYTFNTREEAQDFLDSEIAHYSEEYEAAISRQDLQPRQKAPTQEARTNAANDQLATYKNHESQKATEKAKQLDQEIAAGKTLEDPEPYTFTGDLAHINNELKALDDEILSLEDELGDLAFELDPRLTGEGATDFANIRQAELAVPFSRWKAFLPENPPGNHTWKAEDVTYATQQFIPEYRVLFDEFFELDPTLKDINMEFDPLLLKDHNAAGMYKGSEDRILIAEDYGQPSTVVHELTHASVVRRMRKDMESVGELKGLVLEGERYLASLRRYAALTENDGFRGIIEAYLKTVEHHGTQHTGGYSLASSVNVKTWERFSQRVKEPQYGLLNLDEFIAEGLSNRQFQLYLNSIKSGKETVLSKFMKTVKSVFKLEENPNSVLAQFLDGYETAIKQAGDRIDGPASLKMTKADVRDIGAPVLRQASNCIL